MKIQDDSVRRFTPIFGKRLDASDNLTAGSDGHGVKMAGKLRYIGFTGHKDPHIHLYMLEVAAAHGFRFDAVLMPSNRMDAHFRSFAQL